MDRQGIARVGLLALLCGFSPSSFIPIQAQTGFGVVRGTIHDPTKAVVSKAKLTLRNPETNIARETLASVEGNYYFGEIQPGNYELTVEAAGFKKWVGTLALEVGQTAVIDPSLE